MEGLVTDWLNKVKSQMKEGNPELGLPPLDPLVLEDYSFEHVSLGRYGAIDVLDLHQLKVNEIQNFDIARIEMSEFSRNLTLNLTLPHVLLEGRYNIDGRLLGLVPVRGSGPFHVEFSDVLIIAESKLKGRAGKFKLKTQDLSLEIGRIKIHFHGLFGRRILQHVGNILLKKFGPNISKIFAENARVKLNEVMQHVDFREPLVKKKDGQ